MEFEMQVPVSVSCQGEERGRIASEAHVELIIGCGEKTLRQRAIVKEKTTTTLLVSSTCVRATMCVALEVSQWLCILYARTADRRAQEGIFSPNPSTAEQAC